MAILVLEDGSKIEGLRYPEDHRVFTFISDNPIDESLLDDNLGSWTDVPDDATDEDIKNAYRYSECSYKITQCEDGYYLELTPVDVTAKKINKLQKLSEINEGNMTNVQLALAEIYETMLGE